VIDHDNLDPFRDAAAYDASDRSDTGVAFYLGLALATGGPVLDLACGTGRVAIPIARAGVTVTGLDIVPAMVERAASKAVGLPARWVAGDGRTFDLGERFRLIFLTGNAFQLFLSRADQEALLGRVWAHLDEDGLFAFETRNPRWAALPTRDEPYEGLFTLLENRNDEEVVNDVPGDEHAVRTTRGQTYDHVAQLLHWTTYRRWREGERAHETISRLTVRFTFPQELVALLHYNGFIVVHQYGDWNHEPLSAASPSIIVVCRKRN
jgi:SAM-dependent methyltransferase